MISPNSKTINAVMLHFFFVVVSAMLYKNSGRRRFSGGVFRNINTVSYTHLDVYKRQVENGEKAEVNQVFCL